MEAIINMALLTLLAAVTIAIVVQRSLLSVVILASIYSFLMASVMIVLDAVDVAFISASEMAEFLKRLPPEANSGDIYARLYGPDLPFDVEI